MQSLQDLTTQLRAGEDLSIAAARTGAGALASESIPDQVKIDFLKALRIKGERPEEVATFASVFRDFALDPQVSQWAGSAIDVCGTGGDQSGSFNVSTAVSFVVAATGVPVFKHGNRSITSQCGSAQLLEALGFPLQAPAAIWQQALQSVHFAFFFAPVYHPVFKSIMPARQALAAQGQRTIFNLLGPLINPGRPAYQLMGVFSAEWVDPVAQALDQVGVRRGLVVHSTLPGGGSLDELSCCGDNKVSGVGELAGTAFPATLKELGLEQCAVEDLAGGNVSDNLHILDRLLNGRGPVGLTHTVALNAGAALWIAGKAENLQAGVVLALERIHSGAVATWLQRARDFFKDCQ